MNHRTAPVEPAAALRRGRRLPTFGVLLLLTAAAACEAVEPRQDYGVRAVQFQDMVVPAGFSLRDEGNQSYSREEASWRMGHFVYAGSLRLDEATGYVRQRMPQHSWEVVVDELVNENSRRLRFVRGPYSAEYVFTRAEGATQMVVDYQTDYSRR